MTNDLSKPDPEAVGILGIARLHAAATARRRGRRRHDAPGDVSSRAWSSALESRLRAAVTPAGRRPLRRKPEPSLQAPPVSGGPQTVARRSAAALSREP